jgi:hypothetical protein
MWFATQIEVCTALQAQTETAKLVKETSRDLCERRWGATVPGREDAREGAHRLARGNLLHQCAQADRRHVGSRRRLLGQELANGTVVIVVRMRGGNARLRLTCVTFVIVAMVVKQRGNGDRQQVADHSKDGDCALSRPHNSSPPGD